MGLRLVPNFSPKGQYNYLFINKSLLFTTLNLIIIITRGRRICKSRNKWFNVSILNRSDDHLNRLINQPVGAQLASSLSTDSVHVTRIKVEKENEEGRKVQKKDDRKKEKEKDKKKDKKRKEKEKEKEKSKKRKTDSSKTRRKSVSESDSSDTSDSSSDSDSDDRWILIYIYIFANVLRPALTW